MHPATSAEIRGNAAGAPFWQALSKNAHSIAPKWTSTRQLSCEMVAIALENCDTVAAVLARHDRWMAHFLTRDAARRRAAACGVFVAYARVLDRHGLRARTLLPAIESWTQHVPEFVGTDMAGHLRLYDQDRVEGVVRRYGHWSKHESDGDAGFRWFGAIFFDNPRHPGVEDAFYEVLGRLHVPIRERLLGSYWVE